MIDFISNLVSSTVLYNLAMTILHSLWQGAVLVLLMNLYLKYSHKNSPTFRYNIAFSTLILIGISALATFSFYSLNVDWGGSKNSGLNPASEGNPLGSIPIIATTIAQESFDIKKMIPLISGIWIIGVGFCTMRLLFGYAQIIKIKKSLVLDIPNWLVIKVHHLKNEYGIDRNIKVGISQQVLSPLMMGVIRPIIIFPVAAINQLTPEEIELILRHELGHIIRQDYVQNFIIRTMEVLMFYHPCIWWTTRIIEKERENHCDDYAVQSPENRMFYAKTLVKIREMRASQHYQLALGFSKDNQSLLNRIKRILSHNQKMSIMKGNLIVGIVLLSSLICLSAGTYFFNKTKIDLPERIEVKDIRSLDISIPTFPIKLISSPQDTSKEELRKMIRERQEKIREKSREAREASRELREELRELRKQNGDHSYRIRVNRDWDEKDWEEFSEKMEKWGEEFSEKFESEEFKEKMEKFEKKMEKWGEEFEAKFESEEYKEKMKKFEKDMEEWGEEFAEKFESEEFQLHLEELAEASSELGVGVAASVMEALGEGFQFNFDHDFDFEHDFDFGEMGEGIGEMVSEIVEEVRENIGDLHDLEHDYVYVNADKSEFTNLLLEKLKEDGFYKKNKVSLTMDNDGIKINGKSQSYQISDKYLELIEDYYDLEPGSGQKLLFEYSDKKGSKKNSLTIEKSN